MLKQVQHDEKKQAMAVKSHPTGKKSWKVME